YSVEADISKKYYSRSRQNAAVTILAKCSCIRRNELLTIAGAWGAAHPEIVCIYKTDAGDDEQQHNGDLDHHDHRVKTRRFANSFYQQCRDGDRDQKCRQIENGRLDRNVEAGLF